jgi:hypothetical protein
MVPKRSYNARKLFNILVSLVSPWRCIGGSDRSDISLFGGDRQDTARDQTVIGTTDLRLRSAPKLPDHRVRLFCEEKCHNCGQCGWLYHRGCPRARPEMKCRSLRPGIGPRSALSTCCTAATAIRALLQVM